MIHLGILLCSTWLMVCSGLVESEAMKGLFHLPLIGTPSHVASSTDLLIVASNDVLSGINADGEIDWRKELGSVVKFMMVHKSFVYTLDAGHVRGWSVDLGTMKFSLPLSSSLHNIFIGKQIVAESYELLITDDQYLYSVHSTNGSLLWKRKLPSSDSSSSGAWLARGASSLGWRSAGSGSQERLAEWDDNKQSWTSTVSKGAGRLVSCDDGTVVSLPGSSPSSTCSADNDPGRLVVVSVADDGSVSAQQLEDSSKMVLAPTSIELLPNESLAQCWWLRHRATVCCSTSTGDLVQVDGRRVAWRRTESLTAPVEASFLVEQAISSDNPFGFKQLLVVQTASSLSGLATDSGKLLFQVVFAANQRPISAHHWSSELVGVLMKEGKHQHWFVVYNVLTGTQVNRFQVSWPTSTTSNGDSEASSLKFATTLQSHGAVLFMDDRNSVLLVNEEGPMAAGAHRVKNLNNTVLRLETDLGIDALLLTDSGSAIHAVPLWQFRPADSDNGERVIQFAQAHPLETVSSPAEIYPTGAARLKFLQRNLVAAATMSPHDHQLRIYLLDGADGCLIEVVQHDQAFGPVTVSLIENKLVYTYWNERLRRPVASVLDLFFRSIDWSGNLGRHGQCVVSQTDPSRPAIRSSSFTLPAAVVAATPTYTQRGITRRSLVFALATNQLLEVSSRLLLSGRPKPQQLGDTAVVVDGDAQGGDDNEVALGSVPYQPDLPLNYLNVMSRNLTVHGVRQFVVGVTELESTGLVCTTGRDVFCSQIRPSGSFDILSQPSKLSLSIMIGVLVIATLVTQSMIAKFELKQKWQ